MQTHWESPDGKIKKQIITSGVFGKKPYENCKCEIKIIEGPPEIKDLKSVVVGHQDGDIGRTLDLVLMTMKKGEESLVTVLGDTTFRLRLITFTQEQLIYELSAKQKYDLAILHKDAGVELYKNGRNKDAAYRFNKALKILHSIPVDVENIPEEIDGVPLQDIKKLKGTLYNNLSSCYFKNSNWLLVIDMCKKALTYDENNVKSLFKLAVSYKNDRDWYRSYDSFKTVMELEPNNKACGEHMKFVKAQISESEKRVNNMVKNMFKA